MAKKKKQLEDKEVFLKLQRPHQKGFRLGRHVITMGVAKPFTLNHKEQMELEGKGPKSWLKVVSEKQMASAPTSNAQNREMQEIKKQLDNRVDLQGDESLEDLKAMLEEVQMFDGLVEMCKEKGVEVLEEDTVESLEVKLEELAE